MGRQFIIMKKVMKGFWKKVVLILKVRKKMRKEWEEETLIFI
jgi:hypothetical protein